MPPGDITDSTSKNVYGLAKVTVLLQSTSCFQVFMKAEIQLVGKYIGKYVRSR